MNAWDVQRADGTELTGADVEAAYCEWLDRGDLVIVGGMEYLTSEVLASVDPVAYRCGRDDFVDAMLTDGGWVSV